MIQKRRAERFAKAPVRRFEYYPYFCRSMELYLFEQRRATVRWRVYWAVKKLFTGIQPVTPGQVEGDDNPSTLEEL